jgi:hypothetical protein
MSRFTERDRTEAVANIAASVRRADDTIMAEGHEWYPVARKRAGTRAGREIRTLQHAFPGLPYRTMAAVVAICNMNNTWAGSLTQSRAILAAWQREDGCAPRAGLPVSTGPRSTAYP